MTTPHKPWTLKNVPAESRNAAVQAARKAGQDVGVWVARVCLEAAQAAAKEGRDLVPLHGPSGLPGDKVPEALALPAAVSVQDHLANLDVAARIATALDTLDPAGAGAHFRKVAFRSLTQQLRPPRA